MTSGASFYTADVFTSEMFGSNQLAVFPAAGGLDTRLMRAIAKELNLSETVFVLPPDDPTHTRKLRIFTPGTELPFAGHPTLGAAFVLASIGEVALDASEHLDRLRGRRRADLRDDQGGERMPDLLRAHRGPAP
jgi:PhzF family phenazine biosynthesis protein